VKIYDGEGLSRWAKEIGYKHVRGFDAKIRAASEAVDAGLLDPKVISQFGEYFYVSEKNCRTILKKNLGKRMSYMVPPDKWPGHHFLPVKFKLNFIRAGINFNAAEYGQYVPWDVHDAWHEGRNGFEKYNKLWEEFFTEERTKAEILAYLDELREVYFYVPNQ
jgi:hypothetical protein